MLVFFEHKGDEHDGRMEIIVRQSLENIVVAAEGLEYDRDPRENQAGVVHRIALGGRTQDHRRNDDDDHHDRFVPKKTNTLHTSLDIIPAIGFQH